MEEKGREGWKRRKKGIERRRKKGKSKERKREEEKRNEQ